MNIKEVLASTVKYFKKHNIEEPRLDAEVLLAHILNKKRIQLYVDFDLPLQKEEMDKYRDLIYKRAHHVPVAYLTGIKEFMSLEFDIDENVLIPRPETEQLVENIIEYCQDNKITEPNIVDIGTGSGVIAISLAHYMNESRVLGIDISDTALRVAKKNIEKHQLGDRVKVVQGNILEPLIRIGKDNVDIIVSNPPYINERDMKELSKEVKKEPRLALVAGYDGLKYYRQIIPQAEKILKGGGLLALEIGNKQGEEIKKLLQSSWHSIDIKQDYAGYDRMIFAKLLQGKD